MPESQLPHEPEARMQLQKPVLAHYVVSILSLITLLFSTSGATGMDIDIDGVPLPEDTAPSSTDATDSEFAGTWIGQWDGLLKTILVVEAVNSDGLASVVYSVAANPNRGFEASWFRREAKIVGNVLIIDSEHFSVSFELSQTGRLFAVFGDGFSYGVLAKHDFNTLTNTDTKIRWSQGTSELLKSDLIEDGKPVNLEVVVFKPSGEGPFPLAIVNHGSTGSGDDAALFSDTWTNPWLAEMLNERGWIVAFPQRRGRGKSDGLYDEGFEIDRSQGYTCDTKRSLAGADRALNDIHSVVSALRQRAEVKAEPILLAGNSRGGILSVAYAGLYPKKVKSVVNFVGGWISDGCDNADEINQSLFIKGAKYPAETLWLYGNDDPFYSMDHSRSNFNAFQQAGGKGRFIDATVRGENNGHWVMAIPPLWNGHMDDYLDKLDD